MAISKCDVPDDIPVRVMGLHLGPQGNVVGVAPNMNRICGAKLDAGIAFGAHIRLLVGALIHSNIQDHEVVWTDVNTKRPQMLRGTGVTGVGIHICRHGYSKIHFLNISIYYLR